MVASIAHRKRFWVAVETGTGSERTALASARQLDVEVFFPVYKARPVRGVRRTLPLFEGYLMIRVVRGVTPLGELGRSKGVRRVMRGAGDCHGYVPDAEIRYLKSRCDSEGFVELESEEPPAFALREEVVALCGAFEGQIGEFRGIDQTNSRRAMVAFQFMGREAVSSLSRYDLRALAA